MSVRKAEVAATTSTAVAVRPEGLPLEINAGTVRIPKIKKGEPMAPAVKNGDAGFLDIYTTTGQDDASPKVIGKADPRVGTKAGEAVRFHVLAVKEGRSETFPPGPGGDLISYTLQGGRWLDREGEAPRGQEYVTQTYTVCLPDVEGGADTPFQLMLYRTSLPAAGNINTDLASNANRGGQPHDLAFELSVVKREKGTYTWGVFQARQCAAKDEDVATANDLALRLAALLPRSAPAPVDRPEI